MDRRTFMKTAAGVAVASRVGGAAARDGGPAKTYVLVHGAWHGGWCWRNVADGLRARGHRVFTPTQTGLGERSHLLSRSVDLKVFVQDIVNVLRWEDLSDVILVGHSFGGIGITGAADRAPGRIRHLVYLDGLILENGQSAFSQLPPDVVAARRKAAQESSGGLSLPVPAASVFGVTDPGQAAWVQGEMTPHPLATYEDRLELGGPVGNGRPTTYIVCADPIYKPLAATREWVKKKGWATLQIASGHDAMVIAPGKLTEMLADVA